MTSVSASHDTGMVIYPQSRDDMQQAAPTASSHGFAHLHLLPCPTSTPTPTLLFVCQLEESRYVLTFNSAFYSSTAKNVRRRKCLPLSLTYPSI